MAIMPVSSQLTNPGQITFGSDKSRSNRLKAAALAAVLSTTPLYAEDVFTFQDADVAQIEEVYNRSDTTFQDKIPRTKEIESLTISPHNSNYDVSLKTVLRMNSDNDGWKIYISAKNRDSDVIDFNGKVTSIDMVDVYLNSDDGKRIKIKSYPQVTAKNLDAKSDEKTRSFMLPEALGYVEKYDNYLDRFNIRSNRHVVIDFKMGPFGTIKQEKSEEPEVYTPEPDEYGKLVRSVLVKGENNKPQGFVKFYDKDGERIVTVKTSTLGERRVFNVGKLDVGISDGYINNEPIDTDNSQVYYMYLDGDKTLVNENIAMYLVQNRYSLGDKVEVFATDLNLVGIDDTIDQDILKGFFK